MHIRFWLALLLINYNVSAQVKIIFDTDFGGDADDLGALAMLHHFERRGECKLLGIAVWSTEKYAASAIDAVNRFYGNAHIEIGVRKGESHFLEWAYSKPIADAFPHQLTQETAMDATLLYRQILAAQPDGEVVIVAVGPLKNISNLLDSPADTISPLSGSELVAQKVKEFVIMGGQFPQGDYEWNFFGNMPGLTQKVLTQIKVPIVFAGYELGEPVKTGEVFNSLDKNHPLYVGFMHFSQYAPWVQQHFSGKILANATYDQMAVLYAVRNGVGIYWDKIGNGICVAGEKGDNTWQTVPGGNHAYLKRTMSAEMLADCINRLMLGGDE